MQGQGDWDQQRVGQAWGGVDNAWGDRGGYSAAQSCLSPAESADPDI